MKKLYLIIAIILSASLIHSCVKTSGEISQKNSEAESEIIITEIFSPYYSNYLDEFIESTKKRYIVNQSVRWVDTSTFIDYIEAVKDRDKLPVAMSKGNSEFRSIGLLKKTVGYYISFDTPEQNHFNVYFTMLDEEDRDKTVHELATKTKESESQEELFEGSGFYGDYYYSENQIGGNVVKVRYSS